VESMWREFFVVEDRGSLPVCFTLKGNHLHAIHLDPKRKREGIGSGPPGSMF